MPQTSIFTEECATREARRMRRVTTFLICGSWVAALCLLTVTVPPKDPEQFSLRGTATTVEPSEETYHSDRGTVA